MRKDLRNLSLRRIFLLLKIRSFPCGTPLTSWSPPKARIPTELWDRRVWKLAHHNKDSLEKFKTRFGWDPLTSLRNWFLALWQNLILREGLQWLAENHTEMDYEQKAITECIEKAALADWCEWTMGSRIMFWRWPIAPRKAMLHGHPIWFRCPLPSIRSLSH